MTDKEQEIEEIASIIMDTTENREGAGYRDVAEEIVDAGYHKREEVNLQSKEYSQVRPIDPDEGFKAIPSIKILPEYFEAVIKGRKRAELRLNDRDYKVGDIYDLKEWDAENKQYTGRKQNILITHVLQGFQGLQEGWCMFSFKTIEEVFDEAYEDDTLPSARTMAVSCEKYQKRCAELCDLFFEERAKNKVLAETLTRIIGNAVEIEECEDDEEMLEVIAKIAKEGANL